MAIFHKIYIDFDENNNSIDSGFSILLFSLFLFLQEAKLPKIEDNDILASNAPIRRQKNAISINSKVRKFSDKYAKGKQLGSGPFGHVFQCWVRDEALDYSLGLGYEEGMIDEHGKKRMLTLKILKKHLLSQKPVLDDLLINEFNVLMNARHPNIIRMFDIFQDS